jgi:hypothetical protein
MAPNLVDVLDAQVDGIWADGLAEPVVGVVEVMGKYFFHVWMRLGGTG